MTITPSTTPQQLRAITLRYPGNSSSPVDLNSDGVYDVLLEINPWNMEKADGFQTIVVDLINGVIKVSSDLANVYPPNWANGYPEIIIGRKPWTTYYYNGLGVEFPMRVRDARPFVISFYICVEHLDPSMNFNIAADAWIVRESIAMSLGMPPAKGDLEIMVWLFSQNLNPAGRKIGEEVVPISINGSVIEAVFEVWRHDSVEWGGWQYIAFRPKMWGIRCGYIAYNPIDFVTAASKYATFDISDYYLLGWEIGTEWGTMTSNGLAKFSWFLKDLEIQPGKTLR